MLIISCGFKSQAKKKQLDSTIGNADLILKKIRVGRKIRLVVESLALLVRQRSYILQTMMSNGYCGFAFKPDAR